MLNLVQAALLSILHAVKLQNAENKGQALLQIVVLFTNKETEVPSG